MKYILIYGPVIGLSERPVLKYYNYKFHNATKGRNKALEGPKSKLDYYFFVTAVDIRFIRLKRSLEKTRVLKNGIS